MNEYPRPAKTTIVKIVGGRYRGHWGWMAGDFKDYRKRCERGDTKSIVNVQVPIKGQFTYETKELIEHAMFDTAQMELDLMIEPQVRIPPGKNYLRHKSPDYRDTSTGRNVRNAISKRGD